MKYFFSAFYIRNLYDIIERKLSQMVLEITKIKRLE